LTLNVWALDVPPPGAGLKTVTAAVPAPAMSPGSIAAVSREADRKVVGRSPPFQRTVDVGTKPVPVTVSVNPGPPADAADGLKPVTVGAGLFTLNVCAFEVPPPGVGLKTVTAAVPTDAMSPAAIVAVSCKAETKVVGRSLPFQRTREVGTNPMPFTVSVKPVLPAVAEAGLSPVVVGAGLSAGLIVNVRVFDVPPPGVPLKTVTAAVPAPVMSLGTIVAVSCEADTKVVGRAAPFQRTTDVATKPEPVTVSVKPAPPAVAEGGLSPVVVGAGLFIVNVWAFDAPPPGVGLKTVTAAVPAPVMSPGAIAAVS